MVIVVVIHLLGFDVVIVSFLFFVFSDMYGLGYIFFVSFSL